jgi:uncharacterized membrane protein YhaH (DUF805 family)
MLVAETCFDYYNILWSNPLFDHNRIIEIAIRKNYLFCVISVIAITSGILIIKNSSAGWITGIVSWIMFAILLEIGLWKFYNQQPNELNMASIIFVNLISVSFLVIAGIFNNKEFRIKYSPDRNSWIKVSLIVATLTTAKLLYS